MKIQDWSISIRWIMWTTGHNNVANLCYLKFITKFVSFTKGGMNKLGSFGTMSLMRSNEKNRPLWTTLGNLLIHFFQERFCDTTRFLKWTNCDLFFKYDAIQSKDGLSLFFKFLRICLHNAIIASCMERFAWKPNWQSFVILCLSINLTSLMLNAFSNIFHSINGWLLFQNRPGTNHQLFDQNC